jgi:hypothetical protein
MQKNVKNNCKYNVSLSIIFKEKGKKTFPKSNVWEYSKKLFVVWIVSR